MNKYIVAYLSLFDNKLKQVLVEAKDEVSAVYKYLAEQEDILFEDYELHNNMEDVSEQLFNMDSNISVYTLN